jgi:hypothetical protein
MLAFVGQSMLYDRRSKVIVEERKDDRKGSIGLVSGLTPLLLDNSLQLLELPLGSEECSEL